MRFFRHIFLLRSLVITLWLLLSSVTMNVAFAQAPVPEKTEPVVIGIIQSSQEDLVYIQETLSYLNRTLPDVPFETTYLSENDAHLAILLKKVDYFIVSSGFYTMMSEKTGALALATLKPPQATDPRFGSCALVITKAQNTQYETFQDIRSTRVVSSSPRSFDGRTMVLGEVENLTRYPLNYFGKATFTSGSHLNVIERLRNNNADVGVLPACQYEKYVADGTIATNEFIPIWSLQRTAKPILISLSAYRSPFYQTSPISEAMSGLLIAISVKFAKSLKSTSTRLTHLKSFDPLKPFLATNRPFSFASL